MKKTKKTTALDRLTAQIRTVLRRKTTNNILLGNLLIESRKLLPPHGKWQEWLQDNFDLSLRTAQNYVAAAEYVVRVNRESATVADFANLAPTVLYDLAAGHYNAKEEAAILAATRKCRVDTTRAVEICNALEPPDSDDAEDADDQDDGGDGSEDGGAEEDAEIKAILDGPPPDVPPPAPNTTTDFTLRAFDQAVTALKQLMTKPAARFASTVHTTGDLQGVESFIRAVALIERARRDPSPPGSARNE